MTICEGMSTDLYNAFVDCVCAGACMDACGDNVCAQLDISVDCQTCVADTAAGCGNEYNDCADDV